VKTRAIILAGGEGARLSALTAKRTKPAVPFAGKYRIIDFTISNCVNSNIFDVMVLAQYRPQSLIEHIGSGSPWDLNRDFTGGIRIMTPFKARSNYRADSEWFEGTAGAVQQNFSFIKQGSPDLILLLSGDHIYTMDYDRMIQYHLANQAELTMATIRVPIEQASRFGILTMDKDYRVTSFVEKPENPPCDQVNMGVYLFNLSLLDRALWEDYQSKKTSHDFGKDILPRLIKNKSKVFGFPYSGYWMDVGTINSYWQAHMDLLSPNPPLKLYDRSWIIHTRTEERPPVRIPVRADIFASMLSDGCYVQEGAHVESSVLSPGVMIRPGAVVRESIIMTDTIIESGAVIERAIIDKRVYVGANAHVGGGIANPEVVLAVVGKNSAIPAGMWVEPGATIGVDVVESDYPGPVVHAGETVETKRKPYEI
jgi:glucose-1-phosphate adenylyltransferase